MSWSPAYVGIGSNLEQPITQVRAAMTALASLPLTRVESTSALYGSKPYGPAWQPDYVNAVVALVTGMPVQALFEALRALETRLGKQPPPERWGPRLIDLDLLLFAQLQLETPQLTLPHPGIVQRNFVLYPLREVAPELSIPGHGRVDALAASVDPKGIWRLNDENLHA